MRGFSVYIIIVIETLLGKMIGHRNEIFVIGLLSIWVTCTRSMFLLIKNRPACLVIDEQVGKEVHFYYETAATAYTVEAVFTPEQAPQNRYTLKGIKNETKFKGSSMEICFMGFQGSKVSLNYYTHDLKHLNDLASKSEFYELHEKLIGLGERMIDVSRNEAFEEERHMYYSLMLEHKQLLLKYLVVAKLIAILVTVLAQLFIFKRFLKSPSYTYQPV